MSNTTRWAGVSLSDRRTERRALLIAAAYDLLGTDLLGHDPSALSVRALCRASGLHSRYFYENFSDVDELLGELYDEVAADLAGVVAAAIECAGRSCDRAPRRVSAPCSPMPAMIRGAVRSCSPMLVPTRRSPPVEWRPRNSSCPRSWPKPFGDKGIGSRARRPIRSGR